MTTTERLTVKPHIQEWIAALQDEARLAQLCGDQQEVRRIQDEITNLAIGVMYAECTVEIADNSTGEYATACRAYGRVCVNDECGVCKGCAAMGYLCMGSVDGTHDFGDEAVTA